MPNWLHRKHPELIARRFSGEPFLHSDSHVPRCSVRNPVYVEHVGKWFDAVVPLLLEVQRRGELAALQVDNECPGDGFWSYEMEPPSPNRVDYNEPWTDRPYPMPGAWPSPPPASLEELAPFVELERYADEQMIGAVATLAQMLRDRGITAPLFYDWCCGYWEVNTLLVDPGRLAAATGWLGHNVYAEEVREPFFEQGEYQYSFEEYVNHCFWRPRLVRSLSPGYPVMTPEISAAGELYVQAPLIGGAEAFSIFVLHQIPRDPPELGSYPSWGMEAPLRPDGEPRDRFWNGKTLFTYLAACGEAYARSSSPADVALVYRREPELAGSWAEVHGAGWPQGDPFGEQVHSMNAGRRRRPRRSAAARWRRSARRSARSAPTSGSASTSRPGTTRRAREGWLVGEQRCLGASPGEVAQRAEAVLSGLESHGVAGCLKHYPGLGTGRVDSHRELPVLEGGVAHEEATFRLLAAPRRAVMVAHAVAPTLGDALRPASLSPVVVGRLATVSCGPVIADDLEMGALAVHGSLGERAAAALLAGCDLVLVCNALAERTALVEHVRRWAGRDARLAAALGRASGRVAGFGRGPPAPVSWVGARRAADEARALAGSAA